MTWDAIVVGGGVAGLVAARELAHEGLRTLVLEERDDPRRGGRRAHGRGAAARRRGGVVRHARRHGRRAARRARADRPRPHARAARLLGAPAARRRPPAAHGPARASRRHPWAPTSAGRSGSSGAGAREPRPGAAAPPTSRPTLGALVRRRMGARVLDRLVRPVVGGVHAADPDDLAVDAVAPGPARRAPPGARARSRAAVRSAARVGPGGVGGAGDRRAACTCWSTRWSRTSRRTAARSARVAVTGVRRPVTSAPATTSATRTGWVLATPAAVDLLGLTVGRPDPGAQVTLVTLVLDAPALDARAARHRACSSPREATDVTAKALTHAHRQVGVARAGRRAGPARRAAVVRAGAARTCRARRRPGPARRVASCWASPLSARPARRARGRPVDAGAAPAERRRTRGWSPTCGQRSSRSRGSRCAVRGWPATGWRRWCPTPGAAARSVL